MERVVDMGTSVPAMFRQVIRRMVLIFADLYWVGMSWDERECIKMYHHDCLLVALSNCKSEKNWSNKISLWQSRGVVSIKLPSHSLSSNGIRISKPTCYWRSPLFLCIVICSVLEIVNTADKYKINMTKKESLLCLPPSSNSQMS
jgi:hypothetical protein